MEEKKNEYMKELEKKIPEVYSRERVFILMKHFKEMSKEVKGFYPDENTEDCLCKKYAQGGIRMRGYKVFNPDWTCIDMQYEVGKTYEMEERPIICERGFHFCEKVVDYQGYSKL